MQKYSSGRRGAPAKGIGRVTGARVQIPPSAFEKYLNFSKKDIDTLLKTWYYIGVVADNEDNNETEHWKLNSEKPWKILMNNSSKSIDLTNVQSRDWNL